MSHVNSVSGRKEQNVERKRKFSGQPLSVGVCACTRTRRHTDAVLYVCLCVCGGEYLKFN